MNKKNKIALITGASSGIGKALSFIHAKNGGDIIAVARGKEKLNELKLDIEKKHSVKVYIIEQDLSIQGSGKIIYDKVTELGLKVDYLINNAGFGGMGNFYERDWEDDKSMINVNIMAVAELTRLFLPDFVNRNSGKILNVSSTASLLPGPLEAVYYATKAFVTSFSNAISEELTNTKVTVTNLMPGPTKTNFGKVSGMDKVAIYQKTSSVEPVAKAGYDGMLKGKLDIITGLNFFQKIAILLIPFVSKKFLLKMVHKLQK